MQPANTWTIAAVQMDCRLADFDTNLANACRHINAAADRGARLIVLPECALTGYGYSSRADVLKVADTVPGRATEELQSLCAKRDVFVVVGLVEKDASNSKVYNACVLVGPNGLIGSYRKIHLPCIGLDRHVDPGDRPYAVYDIGGLRVGLAICFDASFPEASRVLTLLGADLIALPTNWATPALKMAEMVCRVRALENHVYFVSVNRVGDEAGFHYIGRSSICHFDGDYLVSAAHEREEIIVAAVDPQAARNKKVVACAGEYELDRVNWRRPEFYESLTKKA
ncbi:MAG: carbon-nitrogen hydrolase family protein [Gemmataceae bacterium]